MTRIVPLACLILLAAVLAAGCGGSGGGSTTGSTSAQAPSSSNSSPPTSSGASQAGFPSEARKPRSSSPSQPGGSHGDQATGAAAFETKGGDNSIQESGSEGSPSELRDAAATLHRYLDARAAGEWAEACASMAKGLTTSLSQLTAGAGGGKGKAPSCAKLLAGLSAGLPPSALHEATVAEVGALRTEGTHGFLLFHGAHGDDYFMPMAREGGEWKVAAIAPSLLS